MAYRNGNPVRLEESATCSTASRTTRCDAWFNDRRPSFWPIQRQPGTNTVDVVDSIRRTAAATSARDSAVGQSGRAFDSSQSIRESIRRREFTLLLTVCLVVLVIFLFLRNISRHRHSRHAVPFSIVGTFAVMYLLGYSLNNLSLMALTLSVGFVVDDAIVMLENIVRHMEMGDRRWRRRCRLARDRLHHHFDDDLAGGVFIPVLFMGGIVGRLLHEFAVTIVIAILISGFVSLTLTPMLGSRFLKIDHEAHHMLLYRVLERGFALMNRAYDVTLKIALATSLRR